MTLLPVNSSSHACGLKNLISWRFTPVDQFWVLPCLVPAQCLPRPSQSMHFGDVSETNGWEMPTKLAQTSRPETQQPRAIMRPRGEAKFYLLLYSQLTHIWEYYDMIMQNDPWRTNARKEKVYSSDFTFLKINYFDSPYGTLTHFMRTLEIFGTSSKDLRYDVGFLYKGSPLPPPPLHSSPRPLELFSGYPLPELDSLCTDILIPSEKRGEGASVHRLLPGTWGT